MLHHGILQMKKKTNKGITALLKTGGFFGKYNTVERQVFLMAPKNNAAGRLGDASRAVKLLTTQNPVLAMEIASELEKAGEEASIDFVLGELKSIFGSKVDKHLIKAHATSWASNPFTLGSYASAEPGSFHLRNVLSQSVDDRIFTEPVPTLSADSVDRMVAPVMCFWLPKTTSFPLLYL